MTEPVESLSGQITRAADLVRLKLREWRTVNHHDVRGLLVEHDRLVAEVASLRLTLGGRTFSADVPEPVGCPLPGACVQVAEIHRLRAENERLRVDWETAMADLENNGQTAAEIAAENERLRAALEGVLEIDGWSPSHPRYMAARAALAAKGGE